MKKILPILLISFLIYSCKQEVENKSLDELYQKKEQLTTKIDSLNNELKAVELEIIQLDDTKSHQLVTTISTKEDVFKHFIEIQGVVKTDKNIEINPEMAGTITKILVTEGDYVQKGAILIELDDSTLKSNINEVKTQVNLAKTTFERQERLWNQKIGSEMQYLQAKTQYESLQKTLETLEIQASKMKIKAPFSGVIDEIFPKIGELVSPQYPVVRLMNLNEVYVEADVTESYISIIKKGGESIVYFPSLGKEVETSISTVGNFINPDNRSFKVKIAIANSDKSIKPNLIADVKIKDFSKNGLIIPSRLLQQDQRGKNYVYTLTKKDENYVALKKFVSFSHEYNNELFITEGLTSDDILIDEGARIVKDGDIVTIRE